MSLCKATGSTNKKKESKLWTITYWYWLTLPHKWKPRLLTIVNTLIEDRLISAAQVIGPVASTYLWKEEVHHADEWMCILKSNMDLFESVENVIKEYHSYDVPPVIAVPIIAGSAEYFAWYSSQLASNALLKKKWISKFNTAHERLIEAATPAHLTGARVGALQASCTCHWMGIARNPIAYLAQGAEPKRGFNQIWLNKEPNCPKNALIRD